MAAIVSGVKRWMRFVYPPYENPVKGRCANLARLTHVNAVPYLQGHSLIGASDGSRHMNEEGRSLTDSALRRVLESESRARGRIAEEEQKAAAALEAARAEARQIETDAVEQARAFQAACAAKAEQRLSDLQDSAEQRLAGIDSESILPRIKAVAEALACELAGIESVNKKTRELGGDKEFA